MHRKRHPFGIVLLIFATIISITFLACDDNFVKPPIKQSKLIECHNQISWDTTSIRNALAGQWDFIHRACMIGSHNINAGSKGVEFTSDNTLTAWEFGDTTDATWHLTSLSDTMFVIEVDPYVRFAEGFVFVCDDCVLIRDEIIDGCSHYLRRR